MSYHFFYAPYKQEIGAPEFFSSKLIRSPYLFYFQALIVEKDTKIAEMDAASSGEAARLRAAMETLKGDLNHLKNEHVWFVL